MYQFFVEDGAVNRAYATITGPDVNHIKNVIRLKIGEEIRISTASGKSYLCRIAELTETFVQADLLTECESTELPGRIVLFQGIPKGDRMETVIEKAAELGVHEIVPVAMRYCVVKLDEKKAAAKQKKWQALALAAAKQSKRSVVPEVHLPVSFTEAVSRMQSLSVRLVPYENEKGMQSTKEAMRLAASADAVGILIGPEGGFAPEEIETVRPSACLFSLGRRILRTDTAAITTLSLVMLAMEMENGYEQHLS